MEKDMRVYYKKLGDNNWEVFKYLGESFMDMEAVIKLIRSSYSALGIISLQLTQETPNKTKTWDNL